MEEEIETMRYATNIFLKGLGAVLPVILTFYLVYWLGRSLEQLLRSVIVFIIPHQYYWPGMGLAAGLMLLFLIGLMVDAWFVRRLFGLGERILRRIPLVKSVYGSLRDFMSYFAKIQKEEQLQKVVAVRIGETHLIGFLTSDEAGKLVPGSSLMDDLVAVYLPMSYQIGGFTVYAKRRDVEPIDMTAEDAMRLILTAGLSDTTGRSKDVLDSS